MSSTSRAGAALVGLLLLVGVAACRSAASPTSAASSVPAGAGRTGSGATSSGATGSEATVPGASPSGPAAALVLRLDALPEVDGATRTAQQVSDASATRTWSVAAGTPACLQVLAVLDAGGYEVVAGPGSDVVDPATCLTGTGGDGVGTSAGTATVLAAGGSEIALTWTATTYSLTATS